MTRATVPLASLPSAPGQAPSAEENTAGMLYRLAEALALSDEPGSTARAWDVACRADAVARLQIAQRTRQYTEAKWRVDEALRLMSARITDLNRAQTLVRTASDIVRMLDNLLLLAAEAK